MPEINPLTKDQLFEKKIAENTGSNYNVGDIYDVVPVTKDQSLLKEIALNSAGLSEDITELEGKVTANAEAIEAIIGVNGSCNIYPNTSESGTSSGFVFTKNTDDSISISGTSDGGWGSVVTKPFTLKAGSYVLSSGISDNYLAYLWLDDATTHADIATTVNTAGKVEFTLNADTTVIGHISARANQTVNTTVYPMLYDARLTPTGYVPYAMTNRELTVRSVRGRYNSQYDVSIFEFVAGGVTYALHAAAGGLTYYKDSTKIWDLNA